MQQGFYTHIPVLRELLPYGGGLVNGVEFGGGFYSTSFLLDRCGTLLTVEMQSETWYSSLRNMYEPRDTWRLALALGPYAFLSLDYPSLIDFAFVDGHFESRPECVNLMMRLGCPIIVAHDTEEPSYGWSRVAEGAYSRYVYSKETPHTTTWIKRV